MVKRLFEDTDEATELRLIELARHTPLWRKLRHASDTRETTKKFALLGLRKRYPRASEEELKKRLAALLLDRDTVIQV